MVVGIADNAVVAFISRTALSRLGKNCYFPRMPLTSTLLASGAGWRVEDVVCTAGPRDRSFEERHTGICIAAVTRGAFQYRSTQGSALLAPGALLLGNDGQCYECGHDHGAGDRCLSFHFTPGYFEAIAAALPGVRRLAFGVPRLPPLPAVLPIVVAVDTARGERNDGAVFEELGLRLAGAVMAALADAGRIGRAPSRRDERRIAAALRRIERDVRERLPLADLAREAMMSPYHFLRVFRQVVGMTPHQFLLRTRLQRAATRLRRSDDPVSVIALESGFDDLSTFNRRFRRTLGLSPGAYRGRRTAAAAAPVA